MADMFKMGSTMKGEIWDEKGRSEIKEILISHREDFINSIRFTYRKDERAIHSQTFGEPANGLKFNMVQFDRPNELLTSLSGKYQDGRLVSIVFGTNKRKYGPFGRTSSTSNNSQSENFEYKFERGRFGGFHGSVLNGSLYAIGVYVKSYEVIDMDDYIDSLFEDYLFG